MPCPRHGTRRAPRHRNTPAPGTTYLAVAYAYQSGREENRLAPLDVQCARLREVRFVDVPAPFRWRELAKCGAYRPR